MLPEASGCLWFSEQCYSYVWLHLRKLFNTCNCFTKGSFCIEKICQWGRGKRDWWWLKRATKAHRLVTWIPYFTGYVKWISFYIIQIINFPIIGYHLIAEWSRSGSVTSMPLDLHQLILEFHSLAYKDHSISLLGSKFSPYMAAFRKTMNEVVWTIYISFEQGWKALILWEGTTGTSHKVNNLDSSTDDHTVARMRVHMTKITGSRSDDWIYQHFGYKFS
jgi:hypothetical protein